MATEEDRAGWPGFPSGSDNVAPPTDHLQVTSVNDAVYSRLRSDILTVRLRPGEPLNSAKLAIQFGVSTTPVRVAIERLAADGLVIHLGRKGSRVAPLSLADLRDIYIVRRSLEGTAASIAAPKLTDSDIGAMRDYCATLRDVETTKPNIDLYLAAEWEMHLVCYRRAGHPRLLHEIEGYRLQAQRYFRIALMDGVNLIDDLEHQQAFCHHCANRDGTAAEMLAQRLLDWTVERVAPRLDQFSEVATTSSSRGPSEQAFLHPEPG